MFPSWLRRQRLVILIATTLLTVSACSGGDGQGQAPDTDPSRPSATPSPTAPGEPPPVEDEPAAEPLAASFFGMHEGRISQGITPNAPVGSLRFWDSGTSWLHLENSPGQFNWFPLDTAVEAAESAGARPLLVLGQTPTFHATEPRQEAPYGPGAASMPDLGAWRRYVTVVAERYGDRIDYQVWNETNVIQYWSGTTREMAKLTMVAGRVIRKVAPEATIAAPPFALRLPSQQRYFAQFWGLQSKGIDLASVVDAVAVHLYPVAEDPPEAQMPLLRFARRIFAQQGVKKPIWNTEINYGLSGADEAEPIPDTTQRDYVMRTYLLNAGSVDRVYWYRWDLGPIANTMLITPDSASPTLAGRSFGTIRRWLDGATMQECTASGGVWECAAETGGETRIFWWKPQGRPTFLSAGKDAQSWTDAEGQVTRCRGACEVPVGETPVMVIAR